MSNVSIAAADPTHPSAKRLLAEGNAFYEENYPPESNHLFDVEDLRKPNVTFLMATSDEAVVGIAALVRTYGYGEIKRMWVDGSSRGRGIGTSLIAEIEQHARGMGLRVIRLETGVNQTEAIAFYTRHGYRRRPPFGDYVSDPLSVFMEKTLAA